MMGANTMKAALEVLQPAIPQGQSQKAIGTVGIGTVEGDIHDIGKSIVAALLTAS
jgi:methanogenic corrinoid protein MtbC1